MKQNILLLFFHLKWFFCSLKPNDCCLRNTLSRWLTLNLSLKITACVFTALIVISIAKVFLIKTLQGWYLPKSCISHLIIFKFWRIILSSVCNICDIKFFFKVLLIYPYFTTMFYNFNIIFFHASAVNRENVFIFVYIQKKDKTFWWRKCSTLFNQLHVYKLVILFWIYTI